MSNRATIVRTEFKNISTGETSLGFRMYDDFDQTYCNTMETIPNNDMELLGLIHGKLGNENTSNMIDSIVENEKGIYIDDTWYDWDEIKDVIG